MHDPVDSEYRNLIVRDLDTSMLVEAGAGSGKTTSLVGRMLALVGSGRCTVDRMAAVTFTRKAASELKGKFQEGLERSVKEEKDDERRDRYWSALLNVERLFAGTIHSFCGRLLRERPIEAGLDPDFQELEEEENALLRDQCWREYLEGLHVENTALLKKITDLGIDPAGLEGTYRSVSLYPEVEVVRKQEQRPDFGRERKLFEEYLERAWGSMPGSMPEKGWDDLQSSLRRVRLRMRHLDIRKETDFIKILGGLDRNIRVTQYKWPNRETAKAEQAAFDRFREEVIAPCLLRWQRYCHFFIMELVIPAVERFEAERRKNSLMNYHDLLTGTASLLRENHEVREYFQGRFTHILVDEFQDTDPIQAEVILYLTGCDTQERSWRKLRVRPGALFIVGDPKQSIYRFRRADIDTYNQVKRIIEESGGKAIPLTANFRSFPSLCKWVNPIFKQKFPAEANQVQPAFESMNAHKEDKGGGVMCITLPKVSRNRAGEAAVPDAERIAAFIYRSLSGENDPMQMKDAGPGDFMILLRYKKNLPVYARALEELGIPYRITGGGAFNDSEESAHLMNLLRSIATPEDQVTLVATLRGAFYGASDDLLFRFRNSGGVFSYLASQERCRDKEAKAIMDPILSSLREMYRWARTLPPAGALARILDRLGVVPLAMTRETAESRAGNILKVLEIGFWESSRSVKSFPEIVERLGEYLTEIEVEEMSVSPGKEDAVRIMNLHKAKGLEARVVFLADPLNDNYHDPELHIRRTGEKAVGYFLASQTSGEYRSSTVGIPPDWDEYKNLETAYRTAEEERLLYVAVTRAKELLVISRYPGKADKGAWKDLSPYLEEIDELPFVPVKPETKKEGRITAGALEAERARRAGRFERAKEKSYEVEAVTREVEARAEEVPFAGDKGMSWGRVVHRMLEATAKGEPLDLGLMAENLLREEERSLTEKESVIGTVKAVMKSGLWKRMKKAEKTLMEVPFSLKVDGGRVPRIMSGVIDLAFKEADGWVIADYKTDKVDGNLDKLVSYYKPQVEMYRRFWTEMSGEDVKEAGLYFIATGKWVII